MLLPDERHEYFSSSDDPWIKIWGNVAGPLPKSLINTYSLNNCTLFPECNCERYITEIHDILKTSHLPPQKMLAKCAMKFHELIQFLAEFLEQGNNISTDAQKLKNYIDTNVYSQITIENLSNFIHRSTSQTIRIFKKQYGMTPYDYHLENRIKRAISLLTSTNFSVKQIADELAFCDEHYFSALFQKALRVSKIASKQQFFGGGSLFECFRRRCFLNRHLKIAHNFYISTNFSHIL